VAGAFFLELVDQSGLLQDAHQFACRAVEHGHVTQGAASAGAPHHEVTVPAPIAGQRHDAQAVQAQRIGQFCQRGLQGVGQAKVGGAEVAGQVGAEAGMQASAGSRVPPTAPDMADRATRNAAQQGLQALVDLGRGAKAALVAAGDHGRRAQLAGQHERDQVSLRAGVQPLQQFGANRLQTAARIELGFKGRDQSETPTQHAHRPGQQRCRRNQCQHKQHRQTLEPAHVRTVNQIAGVVEQHARDGQQGKHQPVKDAEAHAGQHHRLDQRHDHHHAGGA